MNSTKMKPKKPHNVLILGEEPLGYLESGSGDMFWLYGPFCPLPAFEQHREIFDRIEALFEATDDDDLSEEEDDRMRAELYELMAQVDAMVTVQTPTGRRFKVRDFKIQKGQYEYKFDS